MSCFRLPEEDIRANEMIVWLKKLSLQLSLPQTSSDQLLVLLSEQARAIQELHSCVLRQEQTIAELVS